MWSAKLIRSEKPSLMASLLALRAISDRFVETFGQPFTEKAVEGARSIMEQRTKHPETPNVCFGVSEWSSIGPHIR